MIYTLYIMKLEDKTLKLYANTNWLDDSKIRNLLVDRFIYKEKKWVCNQGYEWL